MFPSEVSAMRKLYLFKVVVRRCSRLSGGMGAVYEGTNSLQKRCSEQYRLSLTELIFINLSKAGVSEMGLCSNKYASILSSPGCGDGDNTDANNLENRFFREYTGTKGAWVE